MRQWRQTKVIQLQNKECWQSQEAERQVQKRFFPRSFTESMDLLTPYFWPSSLSDCERINFSHFKPSALVAIYYGNTSKLTQASRVRLEEKK